MILNKIEPKFVWSLFQEFETARQNIYIFLDKSLLWPVNTFEQPLVYVSNAIQVGVLWESTVCDLES